MGRKSVVASYKILDSADISTNVTSNSTNVLNLDQASLHLAWTGSSPNGTLEVQVRNGENDSWFALDFGQTISITGNSGEHQILLLDMPFTDIRLAYTAASGTGTLDAFLTMKVVGA